jgi:hypothetical protein
VTEQQVHRSVVAHLRARAVPGLVFVHCPNEGYRTPAFAAVLSGLGTKAGVPDLLLWHRGQAFGLELKAPKGRTSTAQKQFMRDLENAGVRVAVAFGLNDALAILERWQLVRGRVQ